MSKYSDNIDIYYNDINRQNEPLVGAFDPVFGPPVQAGQNQKIAIMPERGARLFRPLGQIFKYVFRRGWHPSRVAPLAFPVLGDEDGFSPLFGHPAR